MISHIDDHNGKRHRIVKSIIPGKATDEALMVA